MKRIAKLVAPLVLAGGLLAAAGSSANAAAAWYTCEILNSGVTTTGSAFVRLTHISGNPAFQNTWFEISSAARKEMLAVALTAIAGGLEVLVRTDLSVAGTPVLDRFYVRP